MTEISRTLICIVFFVAVILASAFSVDSIFISYWKKTNDITGPLRIENMKTGELSNGTYLSHEVNRVRGIGTIFLIGISAIALSRIYSRITKRIR